MSFDLYSAHQAAVSEQKKGAANLGAHSKPWGPVLRGGIRGGIFGIILYVVLVACFAMTARIGQPSYMPMGAWFISISAIPFSWFLKMHWSLLFFAALNWAIGGAFAGATVEYVKCKRGQKEP